MERGTRLRQERHCDLSSDFGSMVDMIIVDDPDGHHRGQSLFGCGGAGAGSGGCESLSSSYRSTEATIDSPIDKSHAHSRRFFEQA